MGITQLFMQCGPIRYRDDAKKQAEKRPFEHYIIPRFTSLRVPLDKDEKDVTINDLYAEIVTKKRSLQMLKVVETVLSNKLKVIIVTRPIEDFQGKDITSLQETLETLKVAGISLFYKPNIHQKFVVMDQKIVWYGSINLMSFGSAEESIMRLESYNIANELIKNIER